MSELAVKFPRNEYASLRQRLSDHIRDVMNVESAAARGDLLVAGMALTQARFTAIRTVEILDELWARSEQIP